MGYRPLQPFVNAVSTYAAGRETRVERLTVASVRVRFTTTIPSDGLVRLALPMTVSVLV